MKKLIFLKLSITAVLSGVQNADPQTEKMKCGSMRQNFYQKIKKIVTVLYLGEGGGIVDRNVMEFWVGRPILVQNEQQLLGAP
jgi:hypothetical protein